MGGGKGKKDEKKAPPKPKGKGAYFAGRAASGRAAFNRLRRLKVGLRHGKYMDRQAALALLAGGVKFERSPKDEEAGPYVPK